MLEVGFTCGQAPHCRKQHRTEAVSDKSKRERDTKSVEGVFGDLFLQFVPESGCGILNGERHYPISRRHKACESERSRREMKM